MTPYPTERMIINDTADLYYRKGRLDLAKEIKDKIVKEVEHSTLGDLYVTGLLVVMDIINKIVEGDQNGRD